MIADFTQHYAGNDFPADYSGLPLAMRHLQRDASELARNGGPEEGDYPAIEFYTSSLNKVRLSAVEREMIRTWFGPLFSDSSLLGSAFRKKHGYAGDFEIIDRLYRCEISADPAIARWDAFFQNHAAAKAVRNRLRYFHALLDKHSISSRPLRVLNLASGPCRDIAEYFESHSEAEVFIQCVDQDAKAIEYGRTLCESWREKIQFTRSNICTFRPSEAYDLIWSAGLFDYFDDKVFARLLSRFYSALKPGGEIVIGNFGANNPSRPWMELAEWFLHHRSPEKLRELALECGICRERISISQEAEGVNLFLHVRAGETDRSLSTKAI